jgi:UDP-glucuronate decarboxylase
MQKTIFDRKNVLVLGGAGFIGSHLCDELISSCKVICVDNFSTGDEKNIDHLLSNPDFKFIKHDISQPIDLEKLQELEVFKISFQGIQEIYNLACPTSPKNFNDQILDNLLANSFVIKNALDMAVKYQAKLLHYSSSVVYGSRVANVDKLDENYLGMLDYLSERSSYDEGKRFAETMITNYRKVYQVDAKIMRLFRTFGPRMKLADNQMIPDFVSQALENEDLIIYGDENFSSSFVYVSDVIDASTKMMDRDNITILNIGSDVDVPFSKIAQKIIELTNSKSQIRYENEAFFMSSLPLPNINRALEEIGWLPIITLDRGLQKTVDDLRASKGLKSLNHAFS